MLKWHNESRSFQPSLGYVLGGMEKYYKHGPDVHSNCPSYSSMGSIVARRGEARTDMFEDAGDAKGASRS